MEARVPWRNVLGNCLLFRTMHKSRAAILRLSQPWESEENEEWQNLLERIHWLVQVVSTEALTPVHEMALREIRRCYEEVLESGDRSKVQEVYSRNLCHPSSCPAARGHKRWTTWSRPLV